MMAAQSVPVTAPVRAVPVALSTQALRTINAMRGPGATEARRALAFELKAQLAATNRYQANPQIGGR